MTLFNDIRTTLNEEVLRILESAKPTYKGGDPAKVE
jgi:hypothetical protein